MVENTTLNKFVLHQTPFSLLALGATICKIKFRTYNLKVETVFGVWGRVGQE